MGKETKDQHKTKDTMDNPKEKRKAMAGDGQRTTAIEDIMGRNKDLTILLEKPSPKTRIKSKAKVNGKGMENQMVTKVKERDEKKGNKDSEMKERKNPQ